MRTNKVEFMSPGTLFSETSYRSINSWDVAEAAQMAADITERHSAKPFGFRFHEYVTADPVDDGEGGQLEVKPRKIRSSGVYFLNGVALKYDNIPPDEEHQILRGNMRCNGWPYVCETRNSWKSTMPFDRDDFIVVNGEVTVRGDDPELEAYRAEKMAEWKKEYATP